MTTVRQRHLYCDRGDHYSYRNASEYVFDPRDLDAEGQPPAWIPKPIKILLEEGEVEFDHMPTEQELAAAFPAHKKPEPSE